MQIVARRPLESFCPCTMGKRGHLESNLLSHLPLKAEIRDRARKMGKCGKLWVSSMAICIGPQCIKQFITLKRLNRKASESRSTKDNFTWDNQGPESQNTEIPGTEESLCPLGY